MYVGKILTSYELKKIRVPNQFLSQKGKDMITLLIPLVEAVDQKFFGNASGLEQKGLIHTLRKLLDCYTE